MGTMDTSSMSTSMTSASSSISGNSTLKSAATDVLVAAGNVLLIEAADALGQVQDDAYLATEATYADTALNTYQSTYGSQQLVKAALIPRTGETAVAIEFMFNPTDVQFSRAVSIEYMEGARTFRGLPKVNFGFVEPYEIKLAGVVFDTYETGADVYDLIQPLRDAVDFSSFRDPFAAGERTVETSLLNVAADTLVSSLASSTLGLNANAAGFFEYGVDLNTQALELRRPPVFYFIWGSHNYMRCMIKDLSFKLTMFLPDGTPVRAMVDMTLTEVDLGVASHALSARKDIVSSS